MYAHGHQARIEEVHMIVRTSVGYQVVSEKGRNLGDYDSKEAADKRLQRVEFFKHRRNRRRGRKRRNA
jgi:hypothetical protein